ncbi:MAG: TauD/TfdA family dioxygenase [Pseudomonadota bacterium]
MKLISAQIVEHGSELKVEWEHQEPALFHSFWLYDNRQHTDLVDLTTLQKKTSVLDLDLAMALSKVDVVNDGEAVKVTFDNQENTDSYHFSSRWLYENKPLDGRNDLINPEHTKVWNGNSFETLNWCEYASLNDPKQLQTWLQNINEFGFGLLRGVPTESTAVCKVAELFGYVRETNYGRYFDVKSQTNPINLAYTQLGLAAHTDNPYREPAPTLQLLHCLENSTQGGESILVDGFYAAQLLRQRDAAAFDRLAATPIKFHYKDGNQVQLAALHPMIQLQSNGEIASVYFNNRSIAPISSIAHHDIPEFYAAYKKFAQLLDDESLAIKFKLAPGDLFIVDNRRVLHSRTVFTSEGVRWLQGCYADVDGLQSTLRSLESLDSSAA